MHNGKDTVITDPTDIESIAEFFSKVQGANRTNSKGYYGGSYEVQLFNGSRTVLSIGFGDDDCFNCGDYGDGYPARYELWGVTIEQVVRFFSQYDSKEPGTFDKVFSDEKWKPGTIYCQFATSGASGMTGNAVCYTYKVE